MPVLVPSSVRALTLAVSLLALAGCDAREPADLAESPTAPAAPDAADTPRDDLQWTLDEPTRTYLWDMEHHANVLGAHGFKVLRAALAANDEAALRQMLAPDFTGETLRDPVVVRLGGANPHGERLQPSESGSQPMTADAFVAFLLDARRPFATPPKISFGVKKIFPLQRGELDGLWSVLCVLGMRGEREGGAPAEFSCILRMRITRPTEDAPGGTAWIESCSVEQVASCEAPRPLFRDVTRTSGLDVARLQDNWTSERVWHVTGGIFACDFDRDQCTDLLITDVRPGGNALYRGLPAGGFQDVTEDVGLISLRRTGAELQAAFADLDGDGWEDLVLGNGEVWRNDAGAQFRRVGARSNFAALLGEPAQSSLSVADVDRDGRVDVYVSRSGGYPTSYLEDTKDAAVRSLLLLNRGDWQFEDVTEATDTQGGDRSVFSSVWLDANDDLWPDVYVINEFGDGALYLNEQGKRFRELDVDETTDDFGAMGVAAGDVDNDGNVDIYVASMYSKAGSRVLQNMPPDAYPEHVMKRLRRLISGSELYLNHGDLRFTAAGASAQVHDVGWAWGATLSDFDNDGWLDVFATAGYVSRERGEPDG